MDSFHDCVRNLQQKISDSMNVQKRFSEQSHSRQSRNLKTVKIVIELASGGDQAALIKKLFSSDYEPALIAALDTPHTNCLKTICDRFNRATNGDEKISILSLVANSYNSDLLKKIGFVFGSKLFAAAKKFNPKNQKNIPGKKTSAQVEEKSSSAWYVFID